MVWEAVYIHSPQAANRVKVTLRFQGSNRPLQTLQAIKNVKANAAGLTRANNAKPEAPKPESSTVLSNATSEPSMNLQKAQLSSGLPADFFDNHVTKKQKSGKKKTDIQLKLFFISSILGYGNNYLRLVLVLQHFLLLKTKSMSTLTTPVKPQSCLTFIGANTDSISSPCKNKDLLDFSQNDSSWALKPFETPFQVVKKAKGNDAVKFLDPDSYNKTGGSASAQTQSMEPLESKNNLDRLSSSHSEKMGKSGIHHARDLTQTSGKIVGSETKEVKGALPEGFFDNKDADLRARGIVPVKPDVKDEYKEFEKLIQEDLKEVDNRLEEEEFDAAEMIEEAESVEQKVYWEKVEMLKKKKLELKAARSGRQSKEPEVRGKGHSSKEDSSSDDDSDGNFLVDWRAQHL
ncbi:hypothetical protein CK203_020993 [Vitis vinifera]|uniref:ZNF380 coiled-coil domain-containing protein n=1 Tax=Vitis vinifera TaxID=29760 RepID=A0A438JWM2_VITVI|nr:hypothetical protein CK203_020993 [Vitis vinifera]